MYLFYFLSSNSLLHENKIMKDSLLSGGLSNIVFMGRKVKGTMTKLGDEAPEGTGVVKYKSGGQ